MIQNPARVYVPGPRGCRVARRWRVLRWRVVVDPVRVLRSGRVVGEDDPQTPGSVPATPAVGSPETG